MTPIERICAVLKHLTAGHEDLAGIEDHLKAAQEQEAADNAAQNERIEALEKKVAELEGRTSADDAATQGLGDEVQVLALTPTDLALSPGTAGQFYTASFGATGGVEPYTFDGTVPFGTLSAGGGFSGTPTDAGDFTLSVRVTDGAGTSTPYQSYTVSIAAAEQAPDSAAQEAEQQTA
ncbi:MAG: hypothetical protein ACXU82_03755 [Caulobacteraceae bacterium]